MAGRSAALLVVLLCVLVGCSHASAPIVTVHLKGTSIKSLNDLHIGAEYDTVYKDDIRCGGTYQHNELPLLPKTLYVSTERELRGGLRGRAKATADLVARSVTVAAAAARGDGAEVTAVFDTRSKLTLLGASCRRGVTAGEAAGTRRCCRMPPRSTGRAPLRAVCLSPRTVGCVRAEVTAAFDARSKLTSLGASCRVSQMPPPMRGIALLMRLVTCLRAVTGGACGALLRGCRGPHVRRLRCRTASLLLSRRCGGASEDEDDPESALVEDLTVRVTKRVDAETEVTPIWSVATGRVALECRRRTAGGGDLDLFLDPDEGLDARWRDPAAHGAWTLHARVPFRRPRASCVTVRRAWRLTPVLSSAASWTRHDSGRSQRQRTRLQRSGTAWLRALHRRWRRHAPQRPPPRPASPTNHRCPSRHDEVAAALSVPALAAPSCRQACCAEGRAVRLFRNSGCLLLRATRSAWRVKRACTRCPPLPLHVRECRGRAPLRTRRNAMQRRVLRLFLASPPHVCGSTERQASKRLRHWSALNLTTRAVTAFRRDAHR
ncbi:hypothetical protein JKP88DRAFT_295067 [Tribonema minus]|uniref:Uncharacterized protein n=1 Tax=Tribonema minus TaxID=303371 RepID=A0A835ZDR2_9STRA|nr:hypothetical protein JKP88DRAFT_295067 [Tribonema minus]